MSRCPTEVRELLGVAALGKLEPDEQSLLEQHLAGCADCSEELGGLRRLTAVMAGAAPPPAHASELLLARARREQRRRRGIAAGLSVAAAVAALAVVGLSRGTTPRPARTAALVGGEAAPGANGTLTLRRVSGGTHIEVSVDGLPAEAHCHLLVTSKGHQSDLFDWTATYQGKAGLSASTGVVIDAGAVATVVDGQGRQLLVGVARD